MYSKKTVQFMGSDAVVLAADVQGDPANRPVVFMHGGGQTRHAWGDAAARFAGEGFYTVTLDMRGHGSSGWSETGSYRIENFVNDIYQILDQLPKTDKALLPILVGASLGGIMSLVAVGNADKAIASGLVLVDVVPSMNQAGKNKIADFMRANPEGFASVDEVADAVARYLPHRPRPKNSDGLIKNLRTGKDGRYYWHWDPDFMMKEQDFHEPSSRPILEAAAAKIQIPTLLVRGMLSEVVDDQSVADFKKVMPKGKVVNVADAGHMVAGDKNNAFNQAVLDFIKDI
ncbi:MAG: alpha/beta hydrolase [Spongiibacteraceae bacterium]